MLIETERQELREYIRAAAAGQRAAVVVDGVRQLLRSSARPGADAMFCSLVLEKVAGAQIAQAGARRVKTFIVRSVTLEPLLCFLKAEAALLGLVFDLEVGSYGSYIDDLMNAGGALARFEPQLVFVILDLENLAGSLPEICADGRGRGLEAEIEAAAERLGQMLRNLRQWSSARLVIQGFTVPDRSPLGDVGDANLGGSLPRAVERLNERIFALCGSLADCVFFDVDRVAARYGRKDWRDTRLFLASRLPVAADAFGVYARGLARSAAVFFRPSCKVLCTDLDNTLWGGILGEDGPRGIATGSTFPGNCYWEYQRYLKQLALRGILLAAVSKNNEVDVVEAFELRAADLALSLDDFVAKKINWNDKVTSLRELATELSLSLDSFVLIDDNPVECEAVRQQLPEVRVIKAPVDTPWQLLDMLAAEPLFDAVQITEDDLNRAEEYRAQTQRAELASSTPDREEFLLSLETVCTFLPVEKAPLLRAVQLLAKTNQFNLTTRRYSAAEVERFASMPGGQAVAARVRDKFGDAGVVGIGLAVTKDGICRIDSFLLSCRVIGRGIEGALLAEIGARAKQMGARQLIGEYLRTRKNELCADFYPEHGFVAAPRPKGADETSVFYSFDLSQQALTSPRWLKLEGTDDNEFADRTALTTQYPGRYA